MSMRHPVASALVAAAPSEVAALPGHAPCRRWTGRVAVVLWASTLAMACLASPPHGGDAPAPAALGHGHVDVPHRVAQAPSALAVRAAAATALPVRRADANATVGLALAAAVVLASAAGLGWRAWRRADRDRRALSRERLRLRALLQTTSDGMHVLDRGGRLVEFSPAFADMLGRRHEDLHGAHIVSWEAGPAPADNERLLRGLAVGQRHDFSSRFRRADGSLIDVTLTAVGARIDGRDLIYLAARDVTQLRRSIVALRASETFLDRTGRIAAVGGWEFNPATRQLRVTGQTRHLLGLSWSEAPALRRCLRMLSRDARRRLAQGLSRAAHYGLSSDLELPAKNHVGRIMWLRWFAEPVFEDGQVVRWVGAVQDISERQERSAELQREQALRSEVEAALRERGEMLDVLAHEVRQPLNNASAALQSAAAALHDMGEQVASSRLGRAQAVMGQVMARIDNTLAVASQLARPCPMDREESEIDTMIGVAIADMPAADRVRVQVRRETAARTAAMDMSLMRLALRNLLSNALKFSPPGSAVTVRLADSEHPLGLVIDVVDGGSGVPASVLPRLFERGARGPAGTSQGLGLYIVRRVMELHTGRAELLRTGPGGTTMRLLVPAAPDE
jgi:PAS domain S-box-containing protein